jgi:hypothetical protein
MRHPIRSSVRRLAPLAVGAVLAGGLTLGVQAQASAAVAPSDGPDYEMPFPCGDTWNGSSRANHSPSALSIDWNRTDDLGAMVVATAPGVVTSVVNLGNRSYGRYIVVDHGQGRTSLYAHLSAFWSVTGQAVDQGTPLGLVGSSGGSTGPHLHFEERLNRVDQHSYFHRRSFTMGTTQTSQNCGDVPVVGDWDGNGTANVGFLRRSSAPTFHLRRPGRSTWVVPFGWRSDQPLSGDWDGNGTIDVGARRPGLQAFVLRRADGSTRQVPLGTLSDFGVAGDWNGDGTTDLGVWHPSTQVFTLRAANGSTRTVTFGSPGDRPVVGDWNGDGIDDLGVFHASTATFTLRTVTRSGAVSTRRVVWGTSGSLPVAGDWNGDKVDDIGVWNPSTGTFSMLTTPTTAHPRAVTRTTAWGAPRG